MAFDFMPLINLASGFIGQRNANRAISKNNVATGAEKSAQKLYAALADPNSPLLQQLTEQERQHNLAGFQQQLTEMQLADRRAQALGRSPTFFNPERADESISYLTSRGIPQLNVAAQNQAMQRIAQAAGGYRGLVEPQQNRQTIGMQRGISNAATNSGVPAQIFAALQGQDPNKVQNPMMGQYMGFNPLQYNQMRY